jgi:hypothetical protein
MDREYRLWSPTAPFLRIASSVTTRWAASGGGGKHKMIDLEVRQSPEGRVQTSVHPRRASLGAAPTNQVPRFLPLVPSLRTGGPYLPCCSRDVGYHGFFPLTPGSSDALSGRHWCYPTSREQEAKYGPPVLSDGIRSGKTGVSMEDDPGVPWKRRRSGTRSANLDSFVGEHSAKEHKP